MEDFTKIFYEYKDRVYHQALRMLGSREDAEEAVQDIFLRIYKGLPGFRGDSKLSSWIFRIAANVCIAKWKQKKGLYSSIDDESVQHDVAHVSVHPSCDELYENKEFSERVHQCISRLQPEYSAVITLYYFEGMGYEEISSIMNIPVGTVGTYLHRAKQVLRSILIKGMQ